MSSIYLQCVGALSLLSAGLALRMSLFRLAGSPGEEDPNSKLNKWYIGQLLAAEWNPLVVGLLLALHLRGDDSTVATTAAMLLTAARFTFAFRVVAPTKLWMTIGVPSMTVSYAATVVLSLKLLLDM